MTTHTDDTVYDGGELPSQGYYARRDNADPSGYWRGAKHVHRHRAARNPLRGPALGVALLLVLALLAWVPPLRAAFAATEYATPPISAFWYDGSFRHAGDHAHPALGSSVAPGDDTNPTYVAAEIAGLKYAGMQAVIASWWGQGQHNEQVRFPVLAGAASAASVGVIPYYEPEGQGAQSLDRIRLDLAYLARYATVHIGGKPVVFVYNAVASTSTCDTVAKWSAATNGFTTWYVNMKVFGGFASCPVQPSSWHQYAPAASDPSPGESVHLPYSFNISPGFWHYQEAAPRLTRDPARWATNVAHLKASTAAWKIVTSANEWGEGTAFGSSSSWQSPSGWGTYADELHRQLVDGATPSPAPSPTTSPAPSPSPTATASPTPAPTTSSPSPSPTTPAPSPTPTVGDLLVLAAGDIVGQGSTGYGTSSNADGWTATQITKLAPDMVLALGDNQYEQGSATQYAAGWDRGRLGDGSWPPCYLPSHCDAWGRHVGEMYPVPGNHEYGTANAGGYRAYFGPRLAAIGSDTPAPAGALYYSVDRGNWHFIALDSMAPMAVGSAQYQWLQADLAANDGRPTIAWWHHPRWSSNQHGSNAFTAPAWNLLLLDDDAKLVLAGHDHGYERFAPMGTSGPAAGGLVEMVVGTGGRSHYCTNTHQPGQAAYDCTSFGLLALTLHADGSWAWGFRAIGDAVYGVGGPGTYTDSGSAARR